MDTELVDLNIPEAPAPERPDVELYLESIAALREKTLRELLGLRAYWKGEVDDREATLKAVMIANTPDKWPGGNETERATSREKAFASNLDVIAARASLRLAAGTLADINVELDTRDSDRKAAEFKLREREAAQKDRELILKHHEQAMRETELTMAIRALLPLSLVGTNATEL